MSVTITGSSDNISASSGTLTIPSTQSVSAGSTSAPSISPSGDSNTGIFFPSADTIAFAEGGVEAARIDSSARLLVGVSSSSVNGVAVFRGTPAGPTDGGAIFIQRGSTNPVAGGYVGSVAFSDSAGSIGAGIDATADANWSASSFATRLIFSTTAAGASSPTERARFNSTGAFVLAGGATGANGIGIAFPATQSASTNANTLDDYEEGTWTASIATESGTAWTVTTQNSTYIKIGRMVFLHALINYTAKGSAQLSLVQSLPFTSTSEVTLYGYNYRSSDNTLRAMLFTAYSNYGVLLKWIDSGSFVNYFTSTSEFAAAGIIYVAGCYLAAS